MVDINLDLRDEHKESRILDYNTLAALGMPFGPYTRFIDSVVTHRAIGMCDGQSFKSSSLLVYCESSSKVAFELAGAEYPIPPSPLVDGAIGADTGKGDADDSQEEQGMDALLLRRCQSISENSDAAQRETGILIIETSEAEKKGKGFWTNLFHKLRAIGVFIQIVLLIGFNCVVTFPTSFELVLTALSIFNLDILPALGIDCWLSKFDYIHTMISTTIAPIAASLLWFFCFLAASAIAKYRGTDTKKAKVKRLNFYEYFNFFCC